MLLEICTASVGDCVTAETGGADRVELNSGLALGGLTPSAGLIREAVQAVSIPVIVMIRPRDGGFLYSGDEFRVMQQDIDTALDAGAAGVAFGILLQNGRLDRERNRLLVQQAQESESVLHRAFDLTPDPAAALEAAVDCGFSRILTSGQKPTAAEGAPCLAQLIEQAAGRIEVLPGSGIRPDNVRSLIAMTGCTQVHCSLSGLSSDPSGAGLDFRNTDGLSPDTYISTDAAKVTAMKTELDRIV